MFFFAILDYPLFPIPVNLKIRFNHKPQCNIVVVKRKFCSYVYQFHQYQQNKQSLSTLTY